MKANWDLFDKARRAVDHGRHELTEAEREDLGAFVERALRSESLDRQHELGVLYEDAANADAVDDAIMDSIADQAP